MAKWKHLSTKDLATEALALRRAANDAKKNGETSRANTIEEEIDKISREAFRRADS